MPNQEDAKDGIPRKDKDRPSPDVQRDATDGQADSHGRGASDQQGQGSEDYRGDGPAKVGLTSSRQPGLVSPSGVNERDHGSADESPIAAETVNLDDDDEVHPRGKVTGAGGTWDAKGGDSAPLGPPGAGQSDRIGPNDPSNRKL